MKHLLQNRMLMMGIGISILLHAVLLLIKVDLPSSFKNANTDMELRFVIRDHMPTVPIADNASQSTLEMDVASADEQDGGAGGASGGYAEGTGQGARDAAGAGRDASSSRQVIASDGQSDAYGGGQEASSGYAGASDEDAGDSRSVVFRRGAGNHGSGGHLVITAATREPAYAMYYRSLRRRIENIGFLNFPQRNGSRLYGELTVKIPVYQDGSIYTREGGISIERSSGSSDLDNAAVNIVRRAAPFGPFPRNAQTSADVWVIITRLKFTRELGNQPQIRSIQ